MGKRKWVLESDDPALMGFFDVVSREVSRARIRLAVEKHIGQTCSDGLSQDAEGNIATAPPLVPGDLLMPRTPFPVFGPEWNAVRDPATPRRDAKARPPAEPDSEVPRADGDSYKQGDLDPPPHYTLTPPASCLIAAAQEQLDRAGGGHTRGWPSCPAIFPGGNPAEVIRDPVFASENFRNLEAPRSWVAS